MKLPFIGKNKALTTTDKNYVSQPVDRGWYTVFEWFTGAWQRDIEVDRDTAMSHFAMFSCMTLIGGDIGKLRPRMVQEKDEIWTEVPYGDYEVLLKPNDYQNRIQFFEHWIASKLSRGNTYVLKRRDRDRKVIALYVLCPDFVTPLVTESGDVFYRLSQDNLSSIENQVVVPASEIIHDRFNCLFHPLIGLSPIYASGLSAAQGLKIQKNSYRFFENMSQPIGILTSDAAIKDETAKSLKERWDANYSGKNIGKVAVLGDGLKYQALGVTPEDSQLIEQLKMTADIICSTFHVPKYKVIGDPPSFNNIEALEQQYYSQCLQVLIEALELCLDEGLEIPRNKKMGVDFDLDGLLRMDTATQIKSLAESIKGGIRTPNEARKKMNLKKLDGGDTVYMQEQNYSLSSLAKRDAKEDPFEKSGAEKKPLALPKPEGDEDEENEEETKLFSEFAFSITKELDEQFSANS